MEANERAKELYGMGFFDPNRAQEAVGALEMMEFEGKDQVQQYVQQGQTLMNVVQQMSAQMEQMAQMIAVMRGDPLPQTAPDEGGQATAAPTGGGMAARATQEALKAQTPQTGYMQRTAKNAVPSVSGS
jgi:hypothetical protein